MNNGRKVKVGIIGSQFEADIHACAFKIAPEEAEVVAVASPTPGNAAALAKKYQIPRVFTDYRMMLRERDIELVTIAAPNYLHAEMTIECAKAGKHIVCEKPLAMAIEEGERMIVAARQHSILLMYGEELFFTPKYVKAKEMADAGAFGKVHLVKQSEKHFGPHSPWFWDVERSGGGTFMDLGCHGIAFCYWFLGRRRSNLFTARWEHLCTRIKRREKTSAFAYSTSPMALSDWSRTVGHDEEGWTIESKSMAMQA